MHSAQEQAIKRFCRFLFIFAYIQEQPTEQLCGDCFAGTPDGENWDTHLSLPYRLASNRREGLQTARGNCITTILRDSDLLYTVLAFLHSSTEPLGLISQHLAGVERGGTGIFLTCSVLSTFIFVAPLGWNLLRTDSGAHGVGGVVWFGFGRFLCSVLFFSSCDTRLRARNDPYLPSGSVFVHNSIFLVYFSFLCFRPGWWFLGWYFSYGNTVWPSAIGRGRERAQA